MKDDIVYEKCEKCGKEILPETKFLLTTRGTHTTTNRYELITIDGINDKTYCLKCAKELQLLEGLRTETQAKRFEAEYEANFHRNLINFIRENFDFGETLEVLIISKEDKNNE